MRLYEQFVSDGYNVSKQIMSESEAKIQARRLRDMIIDFDRKKRRTVDREKGIPRS